MQELLLVQMPEQQDLLLPVAASAADKRTP